MSLILLFCRTKSKNPSIPSPDILYKKATQLYDNKKYNQAAEIFNQIIINYPGSVVVPSAQYYLAYSYYNIRDYERAQVEFEFLYRQFPTSEFAEEAELMAAVCMYLSSPPYYKDQSKTLQAKKMFERFIRRHPETPLKKKAEDYIRKINEKLAKKEFETAKLYFKFKEYQAALESFNYIVKNFPNTKIAEETKSYIQECKKRLKK